MIQYDACIKNLNGFVPEIKALSYNGINKKEKELGQVNWQCGDVFNKNEGGERFMIELLHVLGDFSVCQLADIHHIDFKQQPLFVAITDDEVSVVCKSSCVPQNVFAQDDGWAMLKIAGVLDFALVGVIARIADLLAQKEISIFVTSTYNTDYILIKAERLVDAVSQLTDHGYKVQL